MLFEREPLRLVESDGLERSQLRLVSSRYRLLSTENLLRSPLRLIEATGQRPRRRSTAIPVVPAQIPPAPASTEPGAIARFISGWKGQDSGKGTLAHHLGQFASPHQRTLRSLEKQAQVSLAKMRAHKAARREALARAAAHQAQQAAPPVPPPPPGVIRRMINWVRNRRRSQQASQAPAAPTPPTPAPAPSLAPAPPQAGPSGTPPVPGAPPPAAPAPAAAPTPAASPPTAAPSPPTQTPAYAGATQAPAYTGSTQLLPAGAPPIAPPAGSTQLMPPGAAPLAPPAPPAPPPAPLPATAPKPSQSFVQKILNFARGGSAPVPIPANLMTPPPPPDVDPDGPDQQSYYGSGLGPSGTGDTSLFPAGGDPNAPPPPPTGGSGNTSLFPTSSGDPNAPKPPPLAPKPAVPPAGGVGAPPPHPSTSKFKLLAQPLTAPVGAPPPHPGTPKFKTPTQPPQSPVGEPPPHPEQPSFTKKGSKKAKSTPGPKPKGKHKWVVGGCKGAAGSEGGPSGGMVIRHGQKGQYCKITGGSKQQPKDSTTATPATPPAAPAAKKAAKPKKSKDRPAVKRFKWHLAQMAKHPPDSDEYKMHAHYAKVVHSKLLDKDEQKEHQLPSV